jgi:hypothetical protein
MEAGFYKPASISCIYAFLNEYLTEIVACKRKMK